ncbi:MAG: DUF6807 family protein [Verrucomicrobiota bacterium]
MSAPLQLRHEPNRHVEILTGGGQLLWRYVYMPDTPANESPRPYAHPVRMPAGDVLTNFRPNDHPWHHALSLTLTSVDGVNFWGGPSYREGEGYRWRDDHGTQVHRAWTLLTPTRMEEIVDWRERATGTVLLEEARTLATAMTSDGGWSLRWTSELRNVAGRALTLGNYHASSGLAGSHYTGLQFRGARELLDEHGDAQIGITSEGDRSGEAATHGVETRWLEWVCQHDGSLRRTRIRFENTAGPLPWFVRAKNPLVAFAFHREEPQVLAVGATLRLDHALTFTPA